MSQEALLASLTPDTRERVEALLSAAREKYGYELKILSARRTCEEQASLYAQGRTKPGNVVTNARGCMSWHVLGRAVDLGWIRPNPTVEDWDRLGALGESLGFVWGKYFKGLNDLPHFEYHPGVKIEQVCVDPSACEEGVARSMGVAFGAAASGGSVWPYVVGAAAVAALAWVVWGD